MSNLPHDPLAEQALIASVLSVPGILDDISPIITAEDFFEPRNQIIFQKAVDLHEQGRPTDPITINSELMVDGLSSQTDGIKYLFEVLSPNNIALYSSDPVGYANIVHDLYRRRQLLDLATTVVETASLGSGLSAKEATMVVEQAIIELAQSEEQQDITSVNDMWDEMIEKMELAATLPEDAVQGVPTGFPQLDELTTGWHGSQVILVGARPAVGKSAIAMDFARAAAYLAGKTVLFFSLEMKKDELMFRLIAAEARVDQVSIRKGRLTEEEWMRVNAVRERIKNGSLLLDTNANVGISEVRSKAMRQKLSPQGLDLLVIDYLQLMKVDVGNKQSTRENQVSALSRSVKLLAKELDIPILILSQLNRSSETRVDKRPAMSDLRESGAIEQDMDVIMLLHRPESQDNNLRPGEADLIVAKNRHGPTDTIPLTPMLQYSKFVPGEGTVARDMSVYDATDEEGQPVYAPPSETDETPW